MRNGVPEVKEDQQDAGQATSHRSLRPTRAEAAQIGWTLTQKPDGPMMDIVAYQKQIINSLVSPTVSLRIRHYMHFFDFFVRSDECSRTV
jgi:hypothetical protein